MNNLIGKKGMAGIQLTLVFISLFAFAFIIGQAPTVEAREFAGDKGQWITIHSGSKKGQTIFVPAKGCLGCHSGLGGAATSGEKTFSLVSAPTVEPGPQVVTPGAKPPAPAPTNTPLPANPAVAADIVCEDGPCDLQPKDAPCQGDGCKQKGEEADGLSGLLGQQAGSVGDILFSGLQWGAIAFGAGQLLGGLLGFSEDNTLALSAALGGAGFVYGALSSASVSTGIAAGAALGVGVLIFVLLYKEIETEIVRFQCLPWQAPVGGDNCELCNDENLPCSEYRCRSLGQACELVNPGTEQERCVNINPNDVNPPIIRPWDEALSFGHSYTDVKLSPPGPGFRITNDNSSDGCLKAFTPLEFGVNTDEPSQCRIDFKSTTNFEDMAAYMGGSNLYSYNHTEIFALPGAKAFENSSFELENGKDLNFYLRCRDKNGNVNEAEYAVRFCMDPSPDTTPPQIEATSVINNGCVAADTDTATVEFYTDEPAECKWSHVDQSYDNMPHDMTCSLNTYQLNAEQLFTCSADLNGIARDGTDFYVRCKDQPGAADNDRNKNEQSYEFRLRGSTELKLKNIRPNETVFGGVSPAPIELYAETLFGCNDGESICYYSTTDNLGDYIQFFDTENEDGISTQRLDLPAGTHDYNIRCVDAGGNVAEDSVTFEVDIDTSAPVIARIYEEDQKLKVVTVRESQCAYTFNNCDFTFEEGTEMPFANTTVHIAEWNEDKTYYIKCRDQFLNENADCSAIVRPSDNFF